MLKTRNAASQSRLYRWKFVDWCPLDTTKQHSAGLLKYLLPDFCLRQFWCIGVLSTEVSNTTNRQTFREVDCLSIHSRMLRDADVPSLWPSDQGLAWLFLCKENCRLDKQIQHDEPLCRHTKQQSKAWEVIASIVRSRNLQHSEYLYKSIGWVQWLPPSTFLQQRPWAMSNLAESHRCRLHWWCRLASTQSNTKSKESALHSVVFLSTKYNPCAQFAQLTILVFWTLYLSQSLQADSINRLQYWNESYKDFSHRIFCAKVWDLLRVLLLVVQSAGFPIETGNHPAAA